MSQTTRFALSLTLALGLFACDSSKPDGAAPEDPKAEGAESTEGDEADGAKADATKAAATTAVKLFPKEFRAKETCKHLPPEMVKKATGIDVSGFDKYEGIKGMCSYRKDDTDVVLTIDRPKKTVEFADTWFTNATKNKSKEEIAEECGAEPSTTRRAT